MHKYFLNSRWKLTRSQIRASYRLSANKHPADRLGENHLNVGTKFGLYNPEYRQQLRQLMHKLKRSTR
jgi:hypothetical protein